MRIKKKSKVLIFFIILIVVALNAKFIGKKIYPINYGNYIEKYSQTYNIDPYLVAAIIKVESNYDKDACSRKNAIGLMQMTPTTAKEVATKMKIQNFNTTMLYEPETNISMACWYLNNLKEEFGDNTDLILAAYNGGRGNVKKWLKDSQYSKDGENLHYVPFGETDKYIKKVQVNYNIYKYLYKDKNFQ